MRLLETQLASAKHCAAAYGAGGLPVLLQLPPVTTTWLSAPTDDAASRLQPTGSCLVFELKTTDAQSHGYAAPKAGSLSLYRDWARRGAGIRVVQRLPLGCATCRMPMLLISLRLAVIRCWAAMKLSSSSTLSRCRTNCSRDGGDAGAGGGPRHCSVGASNIKATIIDGYSGVEEDSARRRMGSD